MKTNFKIFSELLPNSLPKSLLGAALVIMPFSVPAEEVRVSDGIVPGDSNSKWVVGGSVGSIENPFVGEDSHDGYLAPNIEYRGEKLFVKGGELGYNLFRSNGFGVGVVLTGKPSYFADDENYDDNEKLEHIEERDGTLDAGFYFVHNSELGRLKVTVLEEITGEHSGQAFDAHYIFDFRFADWNINPAVGVAWASADAVDYFFGVRDDEVTEELAAYEGDSALNLYTGVRGRYELTDNWDLSLGAAYVKLGSGISDSSMIARDDMLITNIGVNYNF